MNTETQTHATLPFTKMQALGNDFIALNGFRGLPAPDAGLQPYRELAIRMCDRHFGVGADGLFVALPSETADARMLFFNPDGSEDRCGNGLRCFARLLHDEGVTDRTSLRVETYGGTVRIDVCKDGGRVTDVRVDLGAPDLDAARLPSTLPPGPAVNVPIAVDGREWRVTCVSTGTPHAILPVEELPDDETFFSASPRIEAHPLFPDKISVMWTHFVSPDLAEIRIWERVTGETLGCGTGAAAVAVAGRLLGLAPGPVTVRSKGGEVLASWDGGDAVTLTGPAHTVYHGAWPLPPDGGATAPDKMPPPRP